MFTPLYATRRGKNRVAAAAIQRWVGVSACSFQRSQAMAAGMTRWIWFAAQWSPFSNSQTQLSFQPKNAVVSSTGMYGPERH